jgi:hypothetical protein
MVADILLGSNHDSAPALSCPPFRHGDVIGHPFHRAGTAEPLGALRATNRSTNSGVPLGKAGGVFDWVVGLQITSHHLVSSQAWALRKEHQAAKCEKFAITSTVRVGGSSHVAPLRRWPR